ncbi:hypothetical protein RIVM261_071120 [Rivularia sp. IAM M-261]|nr:hypothetical protein RIVM261_071120 [Rivularia sp. IAM M-261]
MLKKSRKTPPKVNYEQKSLGQELLKNIKQLRHKIRQIISYVKQRNRAKWAILLLLLSLLILYTGLAPVRNYFEADLTVKNVSFSYAGNSDKVLINNIIDIKNILVTGVDALELVGNFTSPDNEELDKKLKNSNKLNFQLFGEKSQLEITPINYQQQLAGLAIKDLRLQPDTKVDTFSYNHKNHQLLLAIDPNNPRNHNNQNNNTNSLRLDLGTVPLRVTLTGYKLNKLGIGDSPDAPNPFSFQFQPRITQIRLSLKSQAKLLVDLPEKSEDYEQWFRGDIAVKNVQFYQKDITGENLNDTVVKPAILQGKIRMGERELNINKNQFLSIDEPGIQLIRNFEISSPDDEPEVDLNIEGEKVNISQSAKGLEVRLAGETRRIEVGIDNRFPVNMIQSNFLARLGFPNDFIIAMISGAGAFTVALLGWLVKDFEKCFPSDNEVSANESEC